jgi:hypothetical protein
VWVSKVPNPSPLPLEAPISIGGFFYLINSKAAEVPMPWANCCTRAVARSFLACTIELIGIRSSPVPYS